MNTYTWRGISIRRSVLYAVLVLVAVLGFIWGNSFLTGIQSYRLGFAIWGDVPEGVRILIRKMIHLVEFFALSSVLYVVCKNPFLTLQAGLTVAILDEYIQTLTPGRYGLWTDVVIDFVGVAAAVAFVCTYNRRKRKENEDALYNKV